jgi:bacteriorhodopsin
MLVVGLNESTSKQPFPAAASLVSAARYLTVASWLTYPFVYIIKNVGLAGSTASVYEQIVYSIADVVAKAVFGLAHLGHRVREVCRGGERQAAGSLSVFDLEFSVCLGATACVCACTSRQ